ncbi:hypothetical protein Tco_0060389 [Tanacetum coccineum]
MELKDPFYWWPGLPLLKSVLGSTPIYNMSLYKVPKAILSSMEAIRRDFFNGSKDNDWKIAWVKWAKILWIGDDCFSALSFPRLYALEVDKICYVDIKLNSFPVVRLFAVSMMGLGYERGYGGFRVNEVSNLLDESFSSEIRFPLARVRFSVPISCPIGCIDLEDSRTTFLFRCDMDVRRSPVPRVNVLFVGILDSAS